MHEKTFFTFHFKLLAFILLNFTDFGHIFKINKATVQKLILVLEMPKCVSASRPRQSVPLANLSLPQLSVPVPALPEPSSYAQPGADHAGLCAPGDAIL